jgi:hypothetical protein
MTTTKVRNHNITDRTISEIKLDESIIDAIAQIITVSNLPPRINTVSYANSTFTVLNDIAVSTSGGYIVITGKNFGIGATVIVDTTSASAVTRVSSTRLNVQVPPKSAATYNLYVVNPDGGTGIRVNGITYSIVTTLGKMYSLNGFSDPVNRQIGTDINWNKISSGSLGLAARAATKTDGTLWTWGDNSFGELGHNNLDNLNTPTKVGVLTGWSTPKATNNNVGAIKYDGTLWMWGWNNNGQLGLNDLISRSSPVQVGTLTDWSILSIFFDQAAAIRTNNTLWAWGNNQYGNVGDNTSARKLSPIQIGSNVWSKVSISSSTLAIKTNGTLHSWGRNNNNGQLGLNDRVNRSSPVQVGADTNWSEVFTSFTTNHLIKTNGTLWSLGSNNYGGIGDNTAISRSSPVQVGALTNWSFVSPSSRYVYALKTDGTLWAWGGTVQQQGVSSPVQIGSGTGWNEISMGDDGLIVGTS